MLFGQNAQAEEAIRRCLEWSDQFVAEQIGVPALCDEHWESVGEDPSDLDHAYHEFIGLRPAGKADMELSEWGSLADMVTKMQACARRWDVTLSPNCDL